tara:strand:+ start:213 stop:920 length:708 start_codon:yes stop_codon:yes gene_type:complete
VKLKYLGSKNNLADKLILDRIPRKESRKDFPRFNFNGLDIWNAYEFSFLLKGVPKIIVLEISIPSDSQYTVESKSMKLFLNSFYDMNFQKQIEVLSMLNKKISRACNSKVKILVKNSFKIFDKSDFSNRSGLLIYNGFRSICPVTSQPDWGNVYIYSSTDSINKKEIYNFLYSFRSHGGFHENCIEKIFLEIKEKYAIKHLEVCGRFLRRGGIDINPIRSTHKKLFFKNFREFNQ